KNAYIYIYIYFLFIPILSQFIYITMTSALPTLRKKNAVYQSNVNKRGHVKSSLKSNNGIRLPVPYWVLGMLAFALIGGGKII
ncbi:hypothetical protein BCR42DRAFT_415026, partial [Absidia repens]